MAIQEQLELIRRSVEDWNRWRCRKFREVHWTKYPDLSGGDLRGLDLRGAVLGENFEAGYNYIEVNLKGADLRNADLRGALLRGTLLGEARLSGADLSGAILEDAHLQDTDLTNARLVGTDFRVRSALRANLEGAILTDIIIPTEDASTFDMSFLELAMARNLEKVHSSSQPYVRNYLSKVFEYLHRPSIAEQNGSKLIRGGTFEYFTGLLEKIRAIRSLFQTEDPPQNLIDVVGHITEELIRHLQRKPEALYSIRPRQFEEIIAEILKTYGWEVHLTPATRDGGYDLFAISKDISGITSSWIIECKKYARTRKVGVEIARAVYGVKTDLRVSGAMLATTSRFTRGVYDFKSSKYDFELRDYEGVLEWINEYRPNKNGRILVREGRLLLPGDPGFRAPGQTANEALQQSRSARS